MSAKSVFGIFKSRIEVERCMEALKTLGFLNSDISVLLPDRSGAQDFGHTKATKAPEGAAAGASTGIVVGGTLGLLIGLGALVIPGLGPFIAAGPMMATLAGAGVGGAIGGISGGLIGLGIPEYEAKRYEGHLKNGGILVSVLADDADAVKNAKMAFQEFGAVDISTTSDVQHEYDDKDETLDWNLTQAQHDDSHFISKDY